MAKAQGIIGNFKGKVGNMVGYQLTDSNNKQTQGIRIYQPNVKNPKTSAQAEQRAKLAPINATYRALKMIIDRGNEGLPYGNKSRLAWLKQAFKAEHMPWFEKGAIANMPVACQLTKGSLTPLIYSNADGFLQIKCNTSTNETVVDTIGALSTLLKANYPSLQDGDQITTIILTKYNGALLPTIFSFIIDTTSNTPQNWYDAQKESLVIDHDNEQVLFAVIVSREGANGEHLRSTSDLRGYKNMFENAPYDAASKTAAIKSYMASGAANTDWPQESID